MKEHRFTTWLWRQIYKALSHKFDVDIEYSSGNMVASTIRVRPVMDKLHIDWEKKEVIIKRK